MARQAAALFVSFRLEAAWETLLQNREDKHATVTAFDIAARFYQQGGAWGCVGVKGVSDLLCDVVLCDAAWCTAWHEVCGVWLCGVRICGVVLVV